MTWKKSQEKDQEVCHYFRYMVVIGKILGEQDFTKHWIFKQTYKDRTL